MPGDYCDDGNTDNWDECSNDCKVQLASGCPTGFFLNELEVCEEICGDGLYFGWYQCDDATNDPFDGCVNCAIQPGFTCVNGTSETPSVCNEICGDGVNFGNYACDDGNQADNDGCSSQCTLEVGWTCTPGTQEEASVCTPVCGDGLTVHDEECDDNNLANNDG